MSQNISLLSFGATNVNIQTDLQVIESYLHEPELLEKVAESRTDQ